ncbi:GlsB/YeaQ/YmgE family stress response membrane protein [Polyangium mundeleinium]|uniref:GlsB/YeaQ/YmgE family stress response membrane protein n=1 Tax=Polyangium mundeleinium TaxID=2995306 RepID=A0ABT5EUH2_9BACT|nr:GlsB/YeaQ/YmgE family stress response membrane protein [Polyangium mundeleinium]MDC0745468.1 GlsB/YeaQ/YmgE family stress response membrane protein [Polyangium mundeleinium]
MPFGFLLVMLLIVAALVVGIWATFSVFGVLVTLAIAAVVGWIADQIVPGRLPYGWAGAMVAGLLGSWVGSLLFGHVGPTVARIPIIPGILGAVLVALVVQFLMKRGIGPRPRGPETRA